MDLPRHTKPVWDKCIYCGKPPKPGRRLGDEHIIALALGGSWELEQASCECCERITSTVEKRVADHMVTPVREHLGLLGRNQTRPRTKMPVRVLKDRRQTWAKVPPEDHPAAMQSLKFDHPTAMTGEPLTDDIVAKVVIRTLHPDFARRAALIDGQINLISRQPVAPADLARVLAKIAHSYAMAKLGPLGFRPLLRAVILGEAPFYPARFVGGDGTRKLRDGPTRHYVGFEWVPRIDDRVFLVTTIRLFGEYGFPTYKVVTGERVNPPSPYEPTDAHPIARIQQSGICLADGRLDQVMLAPLSNRGVLTSSGHAPLTHQSLFVPHRSVPPGLAKT